MNLLSDALGVLSSLWGPAPCAILAAICLVAGVLFAGAGDMDDRPKLFRIGTGLLLACVVLLAYAVWHFALSGVAWVGIVGFWLCLFLSGWWWKFARDEAWSAIRLGVALLVVGVLAWVRI